LSYVCQGAFVNVAYFEQFGVTLIEVRTIEIRNSFMYLTISMPLLPICSFCEQAAMHGLPVIATKHGAPVEIHQVHELHYHLLN
jgi:sucrose-phosphate synthase